VLLVYITFIMTQKGNYLYPLIKNLVAQWHRNQILGLRPSDFFYTIFCFVLLCFPILRCELRASCLLSRYSYLLSCLFALAVLETGSHVLPSLAWTVIFLFHILPNLITSLTSICHHAHFFSIGMESHKFFFALAGLELRSSQS
jgi:hypothetical protein